MIWYCALCQHPMYMIIEHDETAAERTPPWGEPDIEAYVERIRRNLDALERYPFLKFNYDFSGVELEDLARRAPDVIGRFRKYAEEGRIGFVNGSYAQPHLHTLGAESNLRQLTEGLTTIERLVGVRVKSYAHQEPAVHDQMPQILKALGYDYAVTPGFFWTISFLTPHEILGVQYQDLRFIQDEEFTAWLGLDGSTIPLYLSQPRLRPKGGAHGSDSHQRALRAELIKDLLHYPPIRCDFPDMVEVDEDWLAEMQGQVFVVLDEALTSRFDETQMHSQARLYTYWGYGEGLEAERLHRLDRQAERALLEAESLSVLAQLLVGRAQAGLDTAWRQLLRAQHHDAYWCAGVGLRAKAVGWAREAMNSSEATIRHACAAIAAQVDTLALSGDTPIFLWEPWPLSRTDVAIVEITPPIKAEAPLAVEFRDAAGQSFPGQILDVETRSKRGAVTRLLAPVTTQGLGYQCFTVTFQSRPEEVASGPSLTYENAFYRAVLDEDGAFTSLSTIGTEMQLIDSERSKGGNFLKALSPGGDPLFFVPEAGPEVVAGEVAQITIIRGAVGNASLRQEICFYHHLPRIDIRFEFDFRDTLYGNYWQDESKLNVYWPVANGWMIHHDIPFGVIKGRENRPFFATSWVRLGSTSGGVAFFHRGTNRFWVLEQVLANVLACGVQGRDIGTRAQPELYIKDYDLRLQGHQIIEYGIYPHAGGWREADVPAQAFSYQHPLRMTTSTSQTGFLTAALSFLKIRCDSLIPTAVFYRDGGLTCRLFETRGRRTSVDFSSLSSWTISSIRNLAGEELSTIPPYSIIEIDLCAPEGTGLAEGASLT